jgi:hypothetical protein
MLNNTTETTLLTTTSIQKIEIPNRLTVIKSLAEGKTLQLPLKEGLKYLNKRLNDDWISFKPVFAGGKKTSSVAYVNWTDISLLLDFTFDFDWSVRYDLKQADELIIITATLTVTGCDGKSKTVDGIGNEDLKDKSYGGAVCGANAQAFRRAAALLGLGRYLYYPKTISATINNKE